MQKNKDELPVKMTGRKLTVSILITVIMISVFYFLLSASEKIPSENADLRMVNGIVGMMHALAPPWFWTMLLASYLLYAIVQMFIQYFRQKKEVKIGVEEE